MQNSYLVLLFLASAGVAVVWSSATVSSCYVVNSKPTRGVDTVTNCNASLSGLSFSDLASRCATPQYRATCAQTCNALLLQKAPNTRSTRNLCPASADQTSINTFWTAITDCTGSSANSAYCTLYSNSRWCEHSILNCNQMAGMLSLGCESTCKTKDGSVTSWCCQA